MILSNQVTCPEIYFDRALLTSLPDNLAEEIKRRGLILGNEVKKVSFVGVLMLNVSTYVFLPRSVKNDIQEQQLTLASNTLKAVTKYGREDKKNIDIMDGGDGKQGLDQLSLIFELLDDFRKNGIYTTRKDIRKLNLGKPDWKRTVNRVTPFPSKNGQPVYLDTHGIKRQYFNNCEIAIIHANIIHKLDIQFSWILTGALQTIAPELKDYSPPKGNISHQVSKLTNELNQAYSDRDIRLLKLLIKYLKKDSGTDRSDFILGVQKFHSCWEHMLGKVLDHTVNLNRKLPTPVYIDKDGEFITADNKGMRTDIIMHDQNTNKYTIADAKYYAATEVTNAPGWGDIVKQLFYEKALKTLDIEASIKNTFIFPGTAGNFKEVKVRDRQKSTKTSPIYIEDFKPIYCYYIDPMEVIDHYLKGKKMNKLTADLLQH